MFWYTDRGFTVLTLVNALTGLPHWNGKIFDASFAFERSAKLSTDSDIRRSMVGWCTKEAKYDTHAFKSIHNVSPSEGRVIMSGGSTKNSE